MRGLSKLVVSIVLTLLSCPPFGFSEAVKRAPAGKKVITNEDLEGVRLRYSATENPTSVPDGKEVLGGTTETGTQPAGEKKKAEEPKSGFVNNNEEMAKVEKDLKEVKDLEVKYQGFLTKYEDSFTTAKTEFQKQTLQWQIEDTQTHLARLSEKRKAIEAKKESILQEAAKQEKVKSPPQ